MTDTVKTSDYKADDIIRLFNSCFEQSYNTVLIKNGDEPVYLPASNCYEKHRIVFNRDYYRSALHEIAHWCLAGKVRRQITDYGYWYEPDGRSVEAQKRFEQAEVKPQAIEWLLSLSCGVSFEVSLDNLSLNDADRPDRVGFTQRVTRQGLACLQTGIPQRAELLMCALSHFYMPQGSSKLPEYAFAAQQAVKLVAQEQAREEELYAAL